MSSDVDICNQALVLIGDSPIAAFTDANDRAVVAKRFYESTRDATLRAHPWNFAITRKTLALEAAVPEFGWDHQFALPTDPLCLRILEVNEDAPGNIPFAIEGRKLLTDESSIKIKFIAQIKDPNLFDSLFVDAFSARLAAKFAIALTKQDDLVKTAWGLYQGMIQEAKTINGMEGTRPAIQANSLLNARMGGLSESVAWWK